MFSPSKYQVPLAVTFVVSLVVLFTPASGVPSGFEHSDKIIHFVLFAVLAYTSRLAGIDWIRTALWVLGFAIASEFLQAILPLGRSGSAADALADAAGVALGLVAASRVLPQPVGNAADLH
ncbi:putative integral membrane protein [Rhodococcus sp. AW25M09]|uniref:VanZ family protein n=1 Tax=Rhodococcus sp. AW25M09 TaxID=1268303 RepID=UPI0002ACE277|nr:VanZ family protein [Rhodococcus sp. AW25M09]CCQ15502.1 putative integral membrane protein [Rhodococcus sp. AW25M09]